MSLTDFFSDASSAQFSIKNIAYDVSYENAYCCDTFSPSDLSAVLYGKYGELSSAELEIFRERVDSYSSLFDPYYDGGGYPGVDTWVASIKAHDGNDVRPEFDDLRRNVIVETVRDVAAEQFYGGDRFDPEDIDGRIDSVYGSLSRKELDIYRKVLELHMSEYEGHPVELSVDSCPWLHAVKVNDGNDVRVDFMELKGILDKEEFMRNLDREDTLYNTKVGRSTLTRPVKLIDDIAGNMAMDVVYGFSAYGPDDYAYVIFKRYGIITSAESDVLKQCVKARVKNYDSAGEDSFDSSIAYLFSAVESVDGKDVRKDFTDALDSSLKAADDVTLQETSSFRLEHPLDVDAPDNPYSNVTGFRVESLFEDPSDGEIMVSGRYLDSVGVAVDGTVNISLILFSDSAVKKMNDSLGLIINEAEDTKKEVKARKAGPSL